MRNDRPIHARQDWMGRAAIRMAAICLAGMGLTACGDTTDKAESPSTSASVARSTTAAPEAASDGGAYCDVFRDQGATLLLLNNASREADPAGLCSCHAAPSSDTPNLPSTR